MQISSVKSLIWILFINEFRVQCWTDPKSRGGHLKKLSLKLCDNSNKYEYKNAVFPVVDISFQEVAIWLMNIN